MYLGMYVHVSMCVPIRICCTHVSLSSLVFFLLLLFFAVPLSEHLSSSLLRSSSLPLHLSLLFDLLLFFSALFIFSFSALSVLSMYVGIYSPVQYLRLRTCCLSYSLESEVDPPPHVSKEFVAFSCILRLSNSRQRMCVLT